MSDADWRLPSRAAIGMLLAGDGISSNDFDGEPIVDDDFLVLLSAASETLNFVAPPPGPWSIVVDTQVAEVPAGGRVAAGDAVTMAPHSAVLLRCAPGQGGT